ncbi:MAG TPA: hypothetical protein VHV10_19415 [Ktedonobacteraceae bacterium]|jgi:chromosome segregation ATPase|nr:hypothetical protein [Ktedonobacteraceae bacterium]
MNQPIEPEDNFEQRIEQIEREIKHIRFTLEHIKLDTGSSRESLDAIERKQSEALKLLRGIGQAQPDHSEKLDTLERGLQVIKHDIEAIHDVFVGDFDRIEKGIESTQGTMNERFDRIEVAMATKDDITRLEGLMMQLLQQKPPES